MRSSTSERREAVLAPAALNILAALAFAGLAQARPEPLLGPSGPVWFGPLPPAPTLGHTEDRGVLVVDPTTGEAWVEVVDLRVEGQPYPLCLTRVWDERGWSWAGETRLLVDSQGVRAWGSQGELPSFPPVYLDPMDPGCIVGSERDNGHGDRLLCTEQGYELLHRDGVHERYDATGLLLERDLGAGHRLLLEWGQDGLASLEAADGRRITIGEARVTGSRLEREAQDPAGQTARYEFDEVGHMVSATSPAGLQHRYLYDERGRLEVLLWSDGSRAVIRRDSVGRVQGIEGPGHQRWRFVWGDDGLDRASDGTGTAWRIQRAENGVTVSDPAGRSATLLLEEGRVAGWKDPAGYSTLLERDASGRVTALRSPNGAHWTIDIDDQARLTRLVGPLGSPWRLDYDDKARRVVITDPAGRSRRYRSDAEGRVVEIDEGTGSLALRRDDAGRVRELVHGNGGRTRIERDALGRILSITDAAGGRTRLSDWTGDVPGTVDGPEGSTWKLMFDRLSRVRAASLPDGGYVDWVRSPAGDIAKIRHNQARTRLDRRTDGAITRIADPLGRLTGWTRDAVGRVTSWLRPDGSELKITRDSRGDARRLELGELRLDIERDMQGRPTALRDTDSDDEPRAAWVRNLAGLVRRITWPQGEIELERDPAGLVRQVRLGERSWTLSRDPAGRLRKVQEGERSWVIRRNGGGLITGLDAPGGSLSLQLDPRGLGHTADLFETSVRWRRDAAGRPARTEGPGGAALGIQRDSAGRPVLYRLPGGVLLRVASEATRRELRLEDASGRAVYEASGTYDELGRLASVTDAAGTVHHRYGPSDELLSVEGEHDAWSVFPGRHEGPPGTLVVTTGSRGRPSSADIALAAPVWGVARKQLDYLLDEGGEVKRIEGDSGRASLVHDALGRLLSVGITAQAEDERLVASWEVEWDPFGRPERIRTQDDDTRLCFHNGRLLGVHERGRSAVFLGDDVAAVMAGDDGHSSLITGIGGYRELALFAQGEPYVAASTPGGLRDLGYPGLLAEGGRLQLFPGGPLLGPTDARDPLSGLPTSTRTAILPWGTTGWPAPEQRTAWPTLDGSTDTPWDPAHWDHEGPWTDPLGLLAALGEVELPLSGAWWQPNSPAAPLPWMPVSLEGSPPALLPARGALPLEDGPVATLFLTAALPPTEPVDSRALLEVLLAGELAGVPDGWPGMRPPAHIPFDHE